MSIKEQLKAEIERRLTDYWNMCFHDIKTYNEDSNVRELKELLGFIQTLEEEPIYEELEREIDRFFTSKEYEEAEKAGFREAHAARHFYNLGRQSNPNPERKLRKVSTWVSDTERELELEKEIDSCWQSWLSPSNQSSVEGVLPKTEFSMYARHFAQWGAEHLDK